jgi:hypothetical protein
MRVVRSKQKELGFHREQRVHHVTRSTTERTTMNSTPSDALATKLAEAALTVLVRTCRQELAAASRDELEAACAAMRAKSRAVMGQLLDDARAAPWVAEAAFYAAALDLAQAGITTLRKS